jgi:hypothetical protein
MKKNNNFLLWLIIISIISNLICGCNNSDKTPKKDDGLVYMKNGKFYLNNEEFFPIAINYRVHSNTGSHVGYPMPDANYFEGDNNFMSYDSSKYYLRADFQMIADMGFNSIRIVGIGEELEFFPKNNLKKYYQAIDLLFEIIKETNLKVIFTLPIKPERTQAFEKYIPLLERLRGEENLMAYDVFNEPIYFDSITRVRTKEEIYLFSKSVRNYFTKYSPEHLITIGLVGPSEVPKWDPNIMDVDFISFHPYEYCHNKILRDIYWISRTVDKPWIIGETSFSADGDSISYDTQAEFTKKLLQQTVNCGGIGFSWWQYKDVNRGKNKYFSNYMGAVNLKGKTQTSNSDLIIKGSPKKLAKILNDFAPVKTGEPYKPDNYYNCWEQTKYRIIGRIVDQTTGAPIENAIIRGWEKNWGRPLMTFSKTDGSFELFADFEIYHFITSATYYSSIQKSTEWEKKNAIIDSIPTINLGDISLQKLF